MDRQPSLNPLHLWRLCSLRPRELSTVLWAGAKARSLASGWLDPVMARVSAVANEFNPQVRSACHACAP
eukprot:365796-Chlamydomonas_euryale.AAC.13